MASCSNDELSDQETDDDSQSDAPQSTTMQLKRSREVKVDDHHCQSDSQVKRCRQSSCSDDEAAIRAVLEQHAMSSTGTESQGAQPVSWPENLISEFMDLETQSERKELLETLSSIGVTVDSRNDVGQTALHIAAEQDLVDVVRELIIVGADTEAVDNARRTPVQSAVESGSTNAMVAFESRLPAELINTPNAIGRTALHIAASEDRVDEVHLLLDCGTDVEVLDVEGRSPLVSALVHESWNSARAILDYRPDVVASSRMDVVVDSLGETVLHILCGWVEERELTPVDIFQRVLDGGVAVNVRDFYGNTPLHTVGLRPEFIQLLIEYGADVNAQNHRGQTPLHIPST